MSPTTLQREVLRPRQAPCETRNSVLASQARATIMRVVIWTTMLLVWILNLTFRLLEPS